MFGKKKENPYDKAAERCLSEMDEYGPGTPEWKANLKSLKKLEKLKASKDAGKRRPSPDVLIMVGGNLAAIALMIIIEERHVLSNKASGMLQKLPNIRS
jgi:hypothetical protein